MVASFIVEKDEAKPLEHGVDLVRAWMVQYNNSSRSLQRAQNKFQFGPTQVRRLHIQNLPLKEK